jgi:transposase
MQTGSGNLPRARANIPPKRNRKRPYLLQPYPYRARNLVERFFNEIRHVGGVAARRANYLSFVKLASIRIWLR